MPSLNQEPHSPPFRLFMRKENDVEFASGQITNVFEYKVSFKESAGILL